MSTALAASILIAGLSVTPHSHAAEPVRIVAPVVASKPSATTAQPFAGVTKTPAVSTAAVSKSEVAPKPAPAPVVKTTAAVNPPPVVATPTSPNPATVAAPAAPVAPISSPSPTSSKWGTYLRPFAADSMWNSRPINPRFDDFVIPKSSYYPAVQEGNYSSGVFLAKATDAPLTVYGPVNSRGLWNPDAEAFQPSITIPRWPADVIPATGSDGHADIVDEQQGIVHSFFKLKNDNGTWRAMQYAWTRIAGRGWGDPAHYFQGARAAAVPTTGGLIRTHEINDSDVMYRHALSMSLTFNALSAKPTFIFPATSADGNAATTNYGKIPEGALVMLPPTFDSSRITSPALRKVVETLKTYGAYIVDRNVGTPFVIYVEIGSGYSLHGGKWNSKVASDLDLIRQELRQVTGTDGWADGDNRAFTPDTNLNLLSMRGPWLTRSGDGTPVFDTWQQAVTISPGTKATTVAHFNNRSITKLSWAQPIAGKSYSFQAIATGGATVKLDIVDRAQNKVVYSTGALSDGSVATFTWPTANFSTAIYVSAPAGQAASGSAKLLEVVR